MSADDTGALRRVRRKFIAIKSSNYDLNNTCNLFCEGCYYFVSEQKTANKRPSADTYDAFFASEAARGVNYPLFSGGEPSLNPDALRIAAMYWQNGIIYTNGIKKIPADIPFRIAISIWGAKERNESLRGEQSYSQALDAAIDDPRAFIYFTINRQNIDDIAEVVADCVKRNIQISFNDFGMTTEYVKLLETGGDDNPYFRLSTKDDNLSLRMPDRLRAADVIDELIDRYPHTVLFSKLLNNWMHRAPAIHTIDPETGMATDCAYLGVSWHRGYGYDLQPLKGKPCAAPEFDCSDCRIGPAATFTLLMRLSEQMRHSPQARADLTELREFMMRFHFYDDVAEREPAHPAALATVE